MNDKEKKKIPKEMAQKYAMFDILFGKPDPENFGKKLKEFRKKMEESK